MTSCGTLASQARVSVLWGLLLMLPINLVEDEPQWWLIAPENAKARMNIGVMPRTMILQPSQDPAYEHAP